MEVWSVDQCLIILRRSESERLCPELWPHVMLLNNSLMESWVDNWNSNQNSYLIIQSRGHTVAAIYWPKNRGNEMDVRNMVIIPGYRNRLQIKNWITFWNIIKFLTFSAKIRSIFCGFEKSLQFFDEMSHNRRHRNLRPHQSEKIQRAPGGQTGSRRWSWFWKEQWWPLFCTKISQIIVS